MQMFFLDQSIVLFLSMYVIYHFDFVLIIFFAEAASSRAT